MASLNASSTTDSITVSWSAPELPPSAYVVTAVCALLCSTLRYLFNEKIIANSTTSATFDSLRPGSQCSITLTVKYELAESYTSIITERTMSKGE